MVQVSDDDCHQIWGFLSCSIVLFALQTIALILHLKSLEPLYECRDFLFLGSIPPNMQGRLRRW